MVEAETFIGQKVHIEVDRPLGSVHPEHSNIWLCLNYGYVPGVLGKDGEELDAYLLGVFTPVSAYDGVCIGVIRRRDGDDKLVVVPEGVDYTNEQILALTEFIERFHDSYLVR
jgi:inorganic pyrophosphatase